MVKKTKKVISLILLIAALLYSLFFGIYFSGFLINGEEIKGTVKDTYYSGGIVENRTYVSVGYINESDAINLPLAYQPFVDTSSNEKVPVVYNNGAFYVGTKSIILIIVLSLILLSASAITLLSYIIKNGSVSMRARNIALFLLITCLIAVILL